MAIKINVIVLVLYSIVHKNYISFSSVQVQNISGHDSIPCMVCLFWYIFNKLITFTFKLLQFFYFGLTTFVLSLILHISNANQIY